jgi:preprotein translocase subunit SecB
MKFVDFRLIKIDFSINPKFNPKKKALIKPEIAINSELRKKQKEIVVSFGLRQITGDTPYFFEVKGAGLFKFDRLPEGALLKQLTSINCPAILFPYLRETIADMVRRAGFSPLHLNPVNFVELAKQLEERKAEKIKVVAKEK